MANTAELVLRFTGDKKQLQEVLTAVRADLRQSGQAQTQITRDTNRQVTNEARNQTRQLSTEETARTRNAQQAARQRSVVLIAEWKREAQERKKIADEAEKSAGGSSGINVAGLANQIPIVSRFTSQFTSLGAEVGGATTALGGFAVGAAAAVAGAAIGIGVIVKLGLAFFEATKQVAEFEGKFFDLSQQVGVSVETLSTLDVMAQRTGGDINTVTGSLAIFQKKLEDSHDPTSEEAKLLKELGVTTLDTETALRQAIKGLFDLGEGSKQTDAVLTLFGKSGRFVNAILKESEGNLDRAAEGMRGMLVTREAAAAADLFNDTLGDTNRILDGVWRNLVDAAIPAFTVFFQDLNKGLTGNAADWSFWRDLVEAEVIGVLATVKTAATLIAIALASNNPAAALLADPIEIFQKNFDDLLKRSRELRNKIKIEADIERIRQLTNSILNAGRPGDRPDVDKAAKEAQARASKDLAIQFEAAERVFKVHRGNLEKEFQQSLGSIDEWEKQSVDLIEQRRIRINRLFDQELADAQRFIKDRDELELAEKAIRLKRANEAIAIQEEIDQVRASADRERLNELDQLFKRTEVERQRRLQELRSSGASEIEIIEALWQVETESHNERVARLEQELNAVSTTSKRKREILQELQTEDEKYTNRFIELLDQRIKALRKEADALAATSAQVKFPEQTPDQVAEGAGAAANAAAGTPPLPQFDTTRSAIDQLYETIGTIFSGDKQTAAIAGVEALSGAFQGLADAAGSAVEAFVLYGNAGTSVRKVTAQIIAGVARQAAVKAVFELAEGFAALALAFFGMPNAGPSASAHFAAAAIYAGIAGIAAVAGRVVAGNSFSKEQSGTGGGTGSRSTGGGGGSSGSGSSGTPETVELDRSVRSQQALTIHVNIKRDAGSIVETVVEDHRQNGPIRRMVRSEIAA